MLKDTDLAPEQIDTILLLLHDLGIEMIEGDEPANGQENPDSS